MNTKPLFTTIDTDYLEALHNYKYIVECITKGVVNENHLRMVCDALMKAKTKHPHFADQMTDLNIDAVNSCLESVRHDNDIQENFGGSIAEEILQEEILEACEQHLQGNRKECGKELADCAAVIFRMMEMNEEGEKK